MFNSGINATQAGRLMALVLSLSGLSAGPAHAAEAEMSPKNEIEVIAGCQAADFVDLEEGAVAEIGFGGPRGYTPRCLRVKAGTEVTILASKRHPLQAMAPVAGVANPFFSSIGGSQEPVVRKLDQPGLFGFFCVNHGDASGEGMAGAILVTK